MKRVCCILLALLSVLVFSACDSSYEIPGLDRFSENICSFGTCDRLLPGDKTFLSSYEYEDGSFYYWTDGDYHQAKAFVRLQYSEDVYANAKAAAENCYYYSVTQYKYDGFVFSEPRQYFDEEYSLRSEMQMFGYDDSTCTLVFISSYGYEFDRRETKTPSLFAELFADEFEEYLARGD